MDVTSDSKSANNKPSDQVRAAEKSALKEVGEKLLASAFGNTFCKTLGLEKTAAGATQEDANLVKHMFKSEMKADGTTAIKLTDKVRPADDIASATNDIQASAVELNAAAAIGIAKNIDLRTEPDFAKSEKPAITLASYVTAMAGSDNQTGAKDQATKAQTESVAEKNDRLCKVDPNQKTDFVSFQAALTSMSDSTKSRPADNIDYGAAKLSDSAAKLTQISNDTRQAAELVKPSNDSVQTYAASGLSLLEQLNSGNVKVGACDTKEAKANNQTQVTDANPVATPTPNQNPPADQSANKPTLLEQLNSSNVKSGACNTDEAKANGSWPSSTNRKIDAAANSGGGPVNSIYSAYDKTRGDADFKPPGSMAASNSEIIKAVENSRADISSTTPRASAEPFVKPDSPFRTGDGTVARTSDPLPKTTDFMAKTSEGGATGKNELSGIRQEGYNSGKSEFTSQRTDFSALRAETAGLKADTTAGVSGRFSEATGRAETINHAAVESLRGSEIRQAPVENHSVAPQTVAEPIKSFVPEHRSTVDNSNDDSRRRSEVSSTASVVAQSQSALDRTAPLRVESVGRTAQAESELAQQQARSAGAAQSERSSSTTPVIAFNNIQALSVSALERSSVSSLAQDRLAAATSLSSLSGMPGQNADRTSSASSILPGTTADRSSALTAGADRAVAAQIGDRSGIAAQIGDRSGVVAQTGDRTAALAQNGDRSAVLAAGDRTIAATAQDRSGAVVDASGKVIVSRADDAAGRNNAITSTVTASITGTQMLDGHKISSTDISAARPGMDAHLAASKDLQGKVTGDKVADAALQTGKTLGPMVSDLSPLAVRIGSAEAAAAAGQRSELPHIDVEGLDAHGNPRFVTKGDKLYFTGVEVAIAAILAVSGAARIRGEQEAEAAAAAELENADPVPKVLHRRTHLVSHGDTLQSIADDLYQNPAVAWLIADMNAANIKDEWIDNKRVVELKSRQQIELPEAEEVLTFLTRLRKDFDVMQLVTVVSESTVDRELLNNFLGTVTGAAPALVTPQPVLAASIAKQKISEPLPELSIDMEQPDDYPNFPNFPDFPVAVGITSMVKNLSNSLSTRVARLVKQRPAAGTFGTVVGS